MILALSGPEELLETAAEEDRVDSPQREPDLNEVGVKFLAVQFR